MPDISRGELRRTKLWRGWWRGYQRCVRLWPLLGIRDSPTRGASATVFGALVGPSRGFIPKKRARRLNEGLYRRPPALWVRWRGGAGTVPFLFFSFRRGPPRTVGGGFFSFRSEASPGGVWGSGPSGCPDWKLPSGLLRLRSLCPQTDALSRRWKWMSPD